MFCAFWVVPRVVGQVFVVFGGVVVASWSVWGVLGRVEGVWEMFFCSRRSSFVGF